MFEQLETPCVLINQNVVEKNLRKMKQATGVHGKLLRPHIKTHKSPIMAQLQINQGASGIMVAKLSEAEVMLRSGITDQFIGYPLIGKLKEDALTRLIDQGLNPTVAVDSREGADLLERVGAQTGKRIRSLIEIDTGLHRCGLNTIPAVLEMASYLKRLNHLSMEGITCFGGHVSKAKTPEDAMNIIKEENQYLATVVAALEKSGFQVLTVSVGGSIHAHFPDLLTVATEVRPGTYIYNDAATVRLQAAGWEDCAASVLASVVSKPMPNRAVIDAGSKTLASDGPINDSYGYIMEHPDLMISRMSEEHGIIENRTGGPVELRIGDRVGIIPVHVCTMMNLHDDAVITNGRGVIGLLPILARGGIR